MTMQEQSRKLMIGISPRVLRNVPAELGFRGKTLQYLEQSVPHWVMALGAMVVMVPTVEREGMIRRADIDIPDYVSVLDGLILQGGADIDPRAYGEAPTHTRGAVDSVRDRFELDLLRAFATANKPVFGICRGMQLINVAFGGTLYQDLQADGATSAQHVRETYDEHSHELRFDAEGWLGKLYPGSTGGRINSIHHQGVKAIGRDLVAEGFAEDGVIELIRGSGEGFVLGVQWHPEFHDGRDKSLLDCDPLLRAFLNSAAARRERPAV
jgi:putative glutamine amidotransferase